MLEFRDILYGRIHLPDWIRPFISLPEFARLRSVRLSNVDSVQYKDFQSPTRWEHGLAVAALAARCGERRGLGQPDMIHLMLAGLLHDVGTPPFAHTVEHVLDCCDHETESHRLLSGLPSEGRAPEMPVFVSQLPQFARICERLGRRLRITVDPDVVAQMVVGDTDLGFLVRGSLDLDNADNVTRACHYTGIEVDPQVPLQLADWLAQQATIPLTLDEVTESSVRAWLGYRRQLYELFYDSSDAELGRQAFLQHLIRRSIGAGLPRASVLRLTDEELLFQISNIAEPNLDTLTPSLRELVQRYRLLEEPAKLADIGVEDESVLRALEAPVAGRWIEGALTNPGFEPLVLVTRRRFSTNGRIDGLFPEPRGRVLVFKLGDSLKRDCLPAFIRQGCTSTVRSSAMRRCVEQLLGAAVQEWGARRPWMVATSARRDDVVKNLEAVGDWSFRLSRNDSFHPYPSTFVYAIPANVLVALGLKGCRIVDLFGGTGQTAVEVAKYGGEAVSVDCNTIATLVARARLTYLSQSKRDRVREITAQDIMNGGRASPPADETIPTWFHHATLDELSALWSFVTRRRDDSVRQLLTACFSAILPSCTARRGEQHGYFADNCPLPKGRKSPPYQPAVRLFLERVLRAIEGLERFYGHFDRRSLSPEAELARVRVIRADVQNATHQELGLAAGSADAVITSPPYLCMADYTLGQRLSYQWIDPEGFKRDFDSELGARRLRFSGRRAVEQYYAGWRSFSQLAFALIRPGGFLATIVGAPVAERFRSEPVLNNTDAILAAEGFEHLWSTERSINWHRNHGYARLKKERVAVYVRK